MVYMYVKIQIVHRYPREVDSLRHISLQRMPLTNGLVVSKNKVIRLGQEGGLTWQVGQMKE
jgi:hypothetical protein